MTKQTAISILLIIILIILSIGWCTERKHHLADMAKMYQSWVDDNTLLTQRIKADSSSLYQMQQKLGTERDARQLAQDDAKNYKTLLAVVKAKVGAQKANIEVQYIDRPTTKLHTDTLQLPDTSCIPIGTAFAYTDKWFYTTGSIGAQNIKIDSVGFYPGNIKVVIGNARKGFLKQSQPAVSLVFENPNLYATQANNIIVHNKQKPRRGLWLLSGVAMGLIGGLLVR